MIVGGKVTHNSCSKHLEESDLFWEKLYVIFCEKEVLTRPLQEDLFYKSQKPIKLTIISLDEFAEYVLHGGAGPRENLQEFLLWAQVQLQLVKLIYGDDSLSGRKWQGQVWAPNT